MIKIKIKNPILPGFNPDPSILRVGEDYYIANSTFEYFPGVQIHHSKDLVNWDVISQPLTTVEHLDMIGNPASGGIWAPCLSYKEGIFYLIFTDVKTWAKEPFKDSYNYLTTATSITGPWSKPIFLNCSGFDPSLFHDDDGRKWLVNMEWDYRKPGVKKFTGILLQELDTDSWKLKGEVIKIFTGTDIGLTEGPHIYKKDGWYYLMVAEGGTSYEHAVTIARSKNLTGPYEVHPFNPILTAFQKDELYIKKSGHASMCDTPDGRYYLAFLCGRPLPGTKRCILGRETSIAELEWKDGWPFLVDGTNNPPEEFESPLNMPLKVQKEMLYEFNNKANLNEFQTLRIPLGEDRMTLKERPSFLRIYGKQSIASLHDQSIYVRRQTDFEFEAETYMEFEFKHFQKMAGLIYRYNEENQYYLRLAYDETKDRMCLGILAFDNGEFKMPLGENEIEVDTTKLYLKLKVVYNIGRFCYSTDGINYSKCGDEFDTSILSDDYANPMGFTGAFIGLACQDMQNATAYADFKYFKYKSL